jgi:hypothetical protein
MKYGEHTDDHWGYNLYRSEFGVRSARQSKAPSLYEYPGKRMINNNGYRVIYMA